MKTNNKWVLYDEGANIYAGQDSNFEITAEETKETAVVFDHRDSQETKVKWYNWSTGCNFKPVSY